MVGRMAASGLGFDELDARILVTFRCFSFRQLMGALLFPTETDDIGSSESLALVLSSLSGLPADFRLFVFAVELDCGAELVLM